MRVAARTCSPALNHSVRFNTLKLSDWSHRFRQQNSVSDVQSAWVCSRFPQTKVHCIVKLKNISAGRFYVTNRRGGRVDREIVLAVLSTFRAWESLGECFDDLH